MSMIGKSLVHYEITSQLGKGGMGEVYRAKDTKLGRDVAIKILPEEFARDADRVARFQREAKLLASLNHPNIATIYGLEESDGTNFLVMELIEGQTLADRIKTGPIPVEGALKLALQIAEALESAHERGVIHRDLKPANIKITPESKIKILDFGLAKAFAEDRGEEKPLDSPTLSNAATRQGIILGTAAYMSPEQARGKPVDKRSDIWAFGVILFEMLTGQALFEGEDVTSTLARVLERQPDYSRLTPNLHPRIRFLLERCLEKDARNRYRNISEARVEIQKVLSDSSGIFTQTNSIAEPRKNTRSTFSYIAAAVILTALIVGVIVWNFRPIEPRQVIRFDYEQPEGQQLITSDWPLDVSPDGKKIVYSTSTGFYLRSVDELTAKFITGTDAYSYEPFFSPDGKWLGFYSLTDRQLKKISINGGAPVTLCDIPGAGMAGAKWAKDDTIVYSQYPDQIMRVSAGGGTPESLVKTSGANILINPQILPNGESMLYGVGGGQPRIMVKPLKAGESKELLPGWLADYLPTGYIIFWSPDDQNLFGVKFDPDKLAVVGEPVPLVEDVAVAAISESGTLAYIPKTATADTQRITLVWVNREGKEETLGTPLNAYAYPKISPDGTRVALSIGSFPNLDIWIWDIVRKSLSKLTFEKTRDMTPVWSPDGKRIAYWADTGGVSPNGVYIKAANGTGEAEKLVSAEEGRQLHLGSWSKDGKNLLLQEMVTWTNMDLCTLPVEGDHTLKRLLQTEYIESLPEISPDGRWIAYRSNESNKDEVYVRPFPEVNKGKWQVSTNGGNSPLWSPDMRELYYLSEDNYAMAVAIETEPTIQFGPPKMLFKNTNLGFGISTGSPWDIHPDGKQFLMMKQSEATSPGEEQPKPKITVVLNWDEEVKQHVPVD